MSEGSGWTPAAGVAAMIVVDELEREQDDAIEIDIVDGGVVMRLEDVPTERLLEELERRRRP